MGLLFWKRKRKITIITGPRRTKSRPEHFEPLPDDSIYENTWISEFDLTNPRDLKLARQIVTLSKKPGHTFDLYRLDEKVAEFDHFPMYQEAAKCVIEQSQGGVCSVRHSSKPKLVLKTYSTQLSPPPQDQDKSSSGRVINEARTKLEQEAITALLESPDATLRNQLATGLLEQRFGIRLRQPSEAPLREKILSEAIEHDPEFRQRYAEHLLNEAILGPKPAESDDQSDPLEQFMAGGEKFRKLIDDMGYQLGSNREVDTEAWGLAVKEFFASGGVSQLFEGLSGLFSKKKFMTKIEPGPSSTSTPVASHLPEVGVAPQDTPVVSDEQPVAPVDDDSSIVANQPLTLPDDHTVMPDGPMI